jgi:5-methyltetrahydrofolate--homocysteine methyltransferase
MKDASQNVLVAARLMNPVQKENYIKELNNEYALLRQKNEEKQVKMVSLEEAQQNKLKLFD